MDMRWIYYTDLSSSGVSFFYRYANQYILKITFRSRDCFLLCMQLKHNNWFCLQRLKTFAALFAKYYLIEMTILLICQNFWSKSNSSTVKVKTRFIKLYYCLMFGTSIEKFCSCLQTRASLSADYRYIKYEGRQFRLELGLTYFYYVTLSPAWEWSEINKESLEPNIQCSANVRTCWLG